MGRDFSLWVLWGISPTPSSNPARPQVPPYFALILRTFSVIEVGLPPFFL